MRSVVSSLRDWKTWFGSTSFTMFISFLQHSFSRDPVVQLMESFLKVEDITPWLNNIS
jgi:hypothetical protein